MQRRRLYRVWSAADIALLDELARSGERLNLIARRLGRTPPAVRHKAWQQGISLRERPR
jgi:hypothetical protein